MAHTESNEKKTTATVTIDGQQVTVPAQATILEAAAQIGIKIPTLCWLKKVSTTGACRICVVKVEGIDRFMTACNTPVKDGIVVTTTSPELEAARKKTLELMLVNHPLDCPVCDAAGECDLQDTCYGLHVDKNKYGAELERLPIRYDWKLLESDPNRCILCEKCVKVCREIVGREAIEIVDRGDRTIIDTITGKPLDCDFCGNCVNACPTGTLISKPFKFRGRPWTFDVTPGICGFCASGCQVEYHSRDGRVERVTSNDDTYNKGNLCVNGRFGYAAFNSTGRLTVPLVRDSSGNQQKSTWDQALAKTATAFKQIASASGAGAVAGIGSPRATNEENYLFQKFLRGAIGSNNIDSEARLGYFPAQIIQDEMLGYSGGTSDMNSIEEATAVIVIGSDLKGESPGFAYRVIQASTKNDAKVILANSRATSMNKYANSFLQCRPGSEAWLVAGLCKAVLAEGAECKEFIAGNAAGLESLTSSLNALSFDSIKDATGVSEAELREAARMLSGSQAAVIYGMDVMRAADAAGAVAASVNLALLTGAVGANGKGIFPLDEKNNTQGMLDMGICPEYLPGYHTYEHATAKFGAAWNANVPAEPGKNLFQIIEGIEKGEIKALYVMGSDPLHFMPDRNRVLKALQQLELLVVQDLFLTETARLAHVVLPAATVAEKSGSFTSVDNRVQCFARAIAPFGQSRTDAEILTKLHGMVAQVVNIQTIGNEAVHTEITALTGLYGEVCDHDGCRMGRTKSRIDFSSAKASFKPLAPKTVSQVTGFALSTGSVLHHNGSMTTWSDNNLAVAPDSYVDINAADAAKAGINCGDSVKLISDLGNCLLRARISTSVQPGQLFAPANFRDTHLNLLYRESCGPVMVKLEKA